jgi:hypothetical protein
VDPKGLGGTPADLEAAPGSHPNPLLYHGSGSSGGGGGCIEGGEEGPTAAAAGEAGAALQRLALSQDDHPLSTSSSSKWRAYFQVGGRAVLEGLG